MSFSYVRMPLVIVAALAAASCSVGLGDYAPTEPPIIPGPNTTLAFKDTGTLALAPGESRTVSVTTSPPGSYEISFALLGAALDASLDKAKVVATNKGLATVTLKAPNASTSFRLRASLNDGLSVELPVAVSDKGFGSIRAVPIYSGTRQVKEWVASVMTGTNCKAITSLLPDMLEAPQNATAPLGEEPVIDLVPVGPNIAVVVGAGRYIWGCTDEPNLKAGEELAVKVTVINKPIDLAATDLDVTLEFDAKPSPLGDVLKSAAVLLTDAMLPSTIEEASFELLNGMEQATPIESADAFTQKRAELGWDMTVAQHLGTLGVAPQQQILDWIAGKLAPTGNPPLMSSQVSGHLKAAGSAPGKAIFTVKKLWDVDAEAAGFPASHLVSWTADASDTVMLGGTIFWMPSQFMGNLALASAQEAMPGVMTMPEALGQLVGCEAIGAALVGYDGCDAVCMADLCKTALAKRWDMGLNASAEAGLVGEITITAAGPAKVNDDAAPMSFDGKWLGLISNTVIAADLGGDVVGVTPMNDATPEMPDPPEAPEAP
jgi:hypothetical protein